MKKVTWNALLALGFLAASMLSGCGGGMSAPPASPISVSVNLSTASVQVSQTASFMATVQNDSANKGVTWSLSGMGCSAAACGALSASSSASGVSITYTAPASVPNPATVTLAATSATDGTKSAATTITITPAPAIVVAVSPTTASVQVGIGTQNFTATLTNDTQNKGVTWTLSGAGCVGNTCGTLSASSSASGTPITYTAPSTVPTPATVTLTASSVTDHNKSAAATITITPLPPSISTTFLPDGVFGTPYHQTIQATGGVAPFTWTVTAGTLPSGLKSDNSTTNTLTISGTPDMVQTMVQFTITVTDSMNQSAMQSYTVNINNPPALTIGTTSVPPGTVNVAYSLTFSAAGGSPPYTWSETGALPPGLTFATTNGTLSGTPTAAGSFLIMVSVTDHTQAAVTKPFTIVVYLASSVPSGRYVFQFQGFNSSGALVAALGSFLADGFGAVSDATVDTNGVGGPLASNPALSGTYSFDANNLGTMNLTGPGGASATFRFALYPNPNGSNISSGGSIIEFDSVKNGAGSISTQDPTAFSASKITGGYVFSFMGGDASGRAAVAGRLTADGSGTLTSGAMDVNESGNVFSNAMFTGIYAVPAGSPNGRGTATLNTTLGVNPVAFNFTFYIQDATALLFLGSDPVSATLPLLSGSMGPQAPVMYSNSTLSGTSVLATAGLTSAGLPDVTGGLFTITPGSGNYGFTYDENSGGTIASNKQVTGTYTVDQSGRVTVTGVGVTHPPVLYLSGLNSGYMLGTDANVSSGTLIALAARTTLQGSLAVKTGAPVTANQENDFGTLTFSSNTVSGSVNIGSPSGFQVKVPVAGTYSIDPGGDRGTITITSGLHVGSSRFYLTGNSRFVFLNSINATDMLPLLFTGGCIQYVAGSRGGQTCK